eukprot:GGOE01014031.1.p1 GENE.GGOE01014031.1~~GGOE01014031.1.p1  ORF type:complete len:263 (-),score=67.05 GGOE01014031.1:249-968(-)
MGDPFERRGVVYLSAIPKGMGITHVRQQLQRYGEVTRLWLANAINSATGKVVPDRYREGWVEFADKSVARRVAEGLNGSPVQADRKMGFHGSLWAMKYLKGIGWHQLSEDVELDKHLRLRKHRAKRQELLDANDQYYRQRLLKNNSADWQRWGGWDQWKAQQQKRKGKVAADGKAEGAKEEEGAAGDAGRTRKRKKSATGARASATAEAVAVGAAEGGKGVSGAAEAEQPKRMKRRRLK